MRKSRKKAAPLSLSGNGGARMGTGPKKRPSAGDPPLVEVAWDALPSAVPVVTRPDDMPAAVQQLYDELAPYARAQGTLIEATDAEFRAVCRHLLIQRRLALSLLKARRIDAKWRQLERTYDSLTRRLETKLRAYRLAPMGAPMVEPQKPAQTSLALLKNRRHAG